MMIFKMTHAKYSLKFCAISLYLISTCLPTAFAQSQAGCLLSVNKVTPLYVSLWAGAVLTAPKSLENIKIIYTYPINVGYAQLADAVGVEKTNIDNWLVGKIDNDRQLVIGKPPPIATLRPSQENDWLEGLTDPERNGLNIVTDNQIKALSDSSDEKIYWTSKLRWESAIDWTTDNPLTYVDSDTRKKLFQERETCWQ